MEFKFHSIVIITSIVKIFLIKKYFISLKKGKFKQKDMTKCNKLCHELIYYTFTYYYINLKNIFNQCN